MSQITFTFSMAEERQGNAQDGWDEKGQRSKVTRRSAHIADGPGGYNEAGCRWTEMW